MTEDRRHGGSDGGFTARIRRALEGDAASLGCIVEMLTPWLLGQARWRLRLARVTSVEADDVVQRAWEIVLPKLFPRALCTAGAEGQDLRDRNGHLGPVLRRYLATTVLNIVNGLAQQRIRDRLQFGHDAGSGSASWPAATSDALARSLRAERARVLLACIDGLKPVDQAILIMAAVEELPREEIARKVAGMEGGEAMTPGALRVRLHRIRERLRECCEKAGIFEGFPL